MFCYLGFEVSEWLLSKNAAVKLVCVSLETVGVNSGFQLGNWESIHDLHLHNQCGEGECKNRKRHCTSHEILHLGLAYFTNVCVRQWVTWCYKYKYSKTLTVVDER